MLPVVFFAAMSGFFFFDLLCMGLLPAGGSNTSITVSQKLSARIPINLRPASNEISLLRCCCVKQVATIYKTTLSAVTCEVGVLEKTKAAL